MYVELLYSADCPNWQLTRQRLGQALRTTGHPETEINLRTVETDEQARNLRFPGSPTIRVDGHDPFPAPSGTCGLTCRVYGTPDGFAGAPTLDQLVRVLTATP